ncbi:hypothetical protein [Autumnicola musiva]|uniref:Uncharacterized protein n=1 Tax=Autumnicola musiva TaxID=3075589 RepID=A0ABU3D7D9_9FLAO|nr:hypothetical protein [Zunongwangia sp. F117]MDT0677424.1 hypothetical protein [Zunongwangia sp. F117]
MKIFKMMVAYVAAITILFTSCSKEETGTSMNDGETATLSFEATLNNLLKNSSSSKQHFSDIPECSDAAPATVRVVLSEDGAEMEPIIIDVLSDDLDDDGTTDYYTDYSEDLELTPGSYELEEFIVYDTSGNIIWLAPIDEDDSGEFNGYVMNPLPLSIELGAGVKKYVDVEVLCYDNRLVNEYGYLFFDIIGKEVYDLCFFVNYCTENGRHYTGNYSLDLWYVGADNEISLYDDSMLNEDMMGVNEYGDYYADPMCLQIPGPNYGEESDEDYLYYEITLMDWEGNYGNVEDGTITKSGYLSWDDVEGLFDADNDDYTDYWHVFLGCGEDDGNGNGGTDCDTTNPNADCDDDGVWNECDSDATNWAQWDCDNDGVPNGEDDCEGTEEGAPVDENGCPIDVEEPLCVDAFLGGIDGFAAILIGDGAPLFYQLEVESGEVPSGEEDALVGTVEFADLGSGQIEVFISVEENSSFNIESWEIQIRQDGSGSVFTETGTSSSDGTTTIVIEVDGAFDISSFMANIEVNLCRSSDI